MADREPPVTNTVRARDELREAILAGALPPGARLRAEPVARRLPTRRTAARGGARGAAAALAHAGARGALPARARGPRRHRAAPGRGRPPVRRGRPRRP